METFSNWRFFVLLFAAIGAAVSAGIFFTFSTFVIKALAQLVFV